MTYTACLIILQTFMCSFLLVWLQHILTASFQKKDMQIDLHAVRSFHISQPAFWKRVEKRISCTDLND